MSTGSEDRSTLTDRSRLGVLVMQDQANVGEGDWASPSVQPPRLLPPPKGRPGSMLEPPVSTRPQTRFDVFLSHDSVDKAVVQRLAEQLRARRLRPWLDVWMLVPGADWQDGLAAGLRESSSCAVLLGGCGYGGVAAPGGAGGVGSRAA